MDTAKSKRILLGFFAVFIIFAVGIYAIANEQFKYEAVTGSCPTPDFLIGEIYDGVAVTQEVEMPADMLGSIEIFAGNFGRENSGTLLVSITDSSMKSVAKQSIGLSEIKSDSFITLTLDQRVELTAGDILTVQLETQNCDQNNAVTVYAGNAFQDNTLKYQINGQDGVGTLCVKLSGYNHLTFYKSYWILVTAIFLLLLVFVRRCWAEMLGGESNLLSILLSLYCHYGFLVKQLVSRDFKTKYKRSALGMAWSFLNPLLTMGVQYIVFSSLFKSNTPNYSLYLLIGIVFFNFFSEAVSMGMTSISQNASLIKKVYIPKYIFPFARVLSSLVNFAFSIMPLFLVILITGTAIKPAILLLLFDILCLFLFILGMTLLLSTAMTFFQDTQFLWGIISMMWQFFTPIFYNESILPEKILPIFRLNPMYQFINFARTCIISGISPPPASYFYCFISALLVLTVGLLVFRKHQDKLVLYL